jgi:hypothetical protein
MTPRPPTAPHHGGVRRVAVRLAGGLVAALVALAPSAAQAQSWRTLDVARQLPDSGAYRVAVEYGGGRLALGAAAPLLLYDMRLKYDADRTDPVHVFTPADRTLRLGVRKASMRLHGGDEEAPELRVGLAEAVPLDLSVELGATEAELDLSRLRLTALRIECGATEATVRFDAPNRERMRALAFDVGAASLTVRRLANANTPKISVDAGVGVLDLDFGGTWTQDVTLAVDASLAAVRVHVPSDVGVRVEVEKALGSFEHDGLAKRDGAYVSDNWASARYKLSVRAEAALGKLELDRQ